MELERQVINGNEGLKAKLELFERPAKLPETRRPLLNFIRLEDNLGLFSLATGEQATPGLYYLRNKGIDLASDAECDFTVASFDMSYGPNEIWVSGDLVFRLEWSIDCTGDAIVMPIADYKSYLG